jgi:hypothetical protein
MKISYRTHPILKKLTGTRLGVMPVHESDYPFYYNAGKDMSDIFEKHCKYFKSSINYITKPFGDAADKASKSLTDLYVDIMGNDSGSLNISGTFIVNELVVMIRHQVKEGSDDMELCMFVFGKSGVPLIIYENSSATGKIFGWVSNTYGIENTQEKIRNHLSNYVMRTVIIGMFKSYADVETSILSKNKKTKIINCKYINDTDLNITHLDSKWFTNLVQSNGFKVRGHFRLQPKIKDEKWTKELIWISEFKKNGYTAKARKLSFTD